MRFGTSIALFLGLAAVSAGLVGVVGTQLRNTEFYVQERLAARAVAAGHAIVFPHGMNESVFRWDLAEEWPRSPDIVVFGSSHSQLVSADFFPHEALFNLSSAGAQLSDHLISWQILRTQHHLPKRWIIFVDPWLFENRAPTDNVSARAEAFANIERVVADPGKPGPFASKAAAIQTERPVWTGQLDSLLGAIDERAREWLDRPVIADGRNYQTPIIHADGSLQRESGPPASAAEIGALAKRQFAEKTDRHRYGTFSAVDPNATGVFKKWIQQLRGDGMTVTFVFEPYHPAIYPAIVAEPHNQLSTLDTKIRELAHLLGCQTLGDYDPGKAGMTEGDFWDGDHLQIRGMRKIFGPSAPADSR